MNVILDDAQRFLDTRIVCDAVAFTLLVRLPLECARSADTTQSNNCGSYYHTSIFQQHYPARKRPPWTPKCAQVPDDVNGDDAHCPDDDQQRRGRRQKWQQPEKVPREYDGRTQKRCCHWPGKLVRRTVWRYAPQRCSSKEGCSH